MRRRRSLHTRVRAEAHHNRGPGPDGTASRAPDVIHWRREHRVPALRHIADRTKDLRWSPTLLQLVLDELHIEDLFVDLVGDPRSVAVRRYPQAIAVALALRHSWRPDDLARVRRRLAVAARPQ
jgi:hypothetical protein